MPRTFVIADVHGHRAALDAILTDINLQKSDTLITLGDYIDRGPDSKGVLDTLLKLQSEVNLISLLGNHEEMLLLAAKNRNNVLATAEWMMNGGDAALDSYDAASPAAGFASIPGSHWQFLTHCRSYYETATHIFVHACINPYLPLDQQDDHTLRWERFNDPAAHISGKILICGHTPQRSGFPRNIGHAVCLDTGIHVGRYLTCLSIDDSKIIQSSPAGDLRRSLLADHLVRPA